MKKKRVFKRGKKYLYTLKYSYSLGFDNVTEAIAAAGSPRKFRNNFEEWCKYKRFNNKKWNTT